MKPRRTNLLLLVSFSLCLLSGLGGPAVTAETTVADLMGHTHIHGLAFDKVDPARIFVATHHGLFKAGPNGAAIQLSENRDDFMGFTPHPTDPAVLFASGHPPAGGNLGFIASGDGGKTWLQLSPGAGGPVDFHQLTVSLADPAILYGAFRGIQSSGDGGSTWTRVGDAPAGLIDLAVSAKDPSSLFAATETGLLVSHNGGANWEMIVPNVPVTTVEIGPDGSVYIFVHGAGMASASEPALDFAPIKTVVPGDSYLTHLAFDASAAARMIAVAGGRVIVKSDDGGASWAPFGRDNDPN